MLSVAPTLSFDLVHGIPNYQTVYRSLTVIIQFPTILSVANKHVIKSLAYCTFLVKEIVSKLRPKISAITGKMVRISYGQRRNSDRNDKRVVSSRSSWQTSPWRGLLLEAKILSLANFHPFTMAAIIKLDHRKPLTYGSALDKDEIILRKAAHFEAVEKVCQLLWDQRQDIKALAEHYL
ncbi:hypothetical protein VTL71DRAFT_6571 [Oculimacula yallundae]|uniref:Uncharacterized protein n=1 Tax=Oculimacula yallundae TaxID=86028 RepID=A0ABR4BXB2_9HELO